MKSFAQHVGIQRVNSLARTAFTLMSQRGVDPLKFLEWYVEEGVLLAEEDLPAQAVDWLQDQLLIESWPGVVGAVGAGVAGALGATAGSAFGPIGTAAGAFGGVGVGQKIGDYFANKSAPAAPKPTDDPALKSSLQALDVLSKNLPKEMGSNAGFTNALHSLIAILRNPVPIGQAPAAPAPVPVTTLASPAGPAATHTSWHQPQGTAFLERQINKQKITKACVEMSRAGIDPRKFAEWYGYEGRHLSMEDFREGFLGNTWNGVKSWWGGKGFQKGYNQAADDETAQAQNKAVNDAAVALQQLQDAASKNQPLGAALQGYGTMDKLKVVLDVLQQKKQEIDAITPDQEDAPNAQQAQPEQQPDLNNPAQVQQYIQTTKDPEIQKIIASVVSTGDQVTDDKAKIAKVTDYLRQTSMQTTDGKGESVDGEDALNEFFRSVIGQASRKHRWFN